MQNDTTNLIRYEDGLLIVKMAKKQTGSGLVTLKSNIVKASDEHQRDIDILVDVSSVEESDEDANHIARTFFDGLPFRRMAVYGGSRAVTVGIRLILNLFISMGRGEVKLFRLEAKARDWLAGNNRH